MPWYVWALLAWLAASIIAAMFWAAFRGIDHARYDDFDDHVDTCPFVEDAD